MNFDEANRTHIHVYIRETSTRMIELFMPKKTVETYEFI